jgi:hypothetical protein
VIEIDEAIECLRQAREVTLAGIELDHDDSIARAASMLDTLRDAFPKEFAMTKLKWAAADPRHVHSWPDIEDEVLSAINALIVKDFRIRHVRRERNRQNAKRPRGSRFLDWMNDEARNIFAKYGNRSESNPRLADRTLDAIANAAVERGDKRDFPDRRTVANWIKKLRDQSGR